MSGIVNKKLLKSEEIGVQEIDKIEKYSKGGDNRGQSITDMGTSEDFSKLEVGGIYNYSDYGVFIPTYKEEDRITGYVIASRGVSLFVIEDGEITSFRNIVTQISQINHGTNDTTFTLPSNEFHVWGEVSSLNITLGAQDVGHINEYMFEFISGSTPTVLTLPTSVTFLEDYEIEANKKYQVSIVDNIGLIVGVDYE